MSGDFSARLSAHVISLERTPQRLEQFRKWNAPTGITFEAFKAFDGRNINLATVEPAILRPGTTTYKAGSVGSALSHRALWQRCGEGETPFFICEDDAALRSDIASLIPGIVDGLPEGWDMVCLGYNTDTGIELDIGAGVRLLFGFPGGNATPVQLDAFAGTRGATGVARLTNFFGLCAYLVSPAGARRLAQLCFPLDSRPIFMRSINRQIFAFTLDGRINDHLQQLRAYACIPPLALPNNAAGSSVKG